MSSRHQFLPWTAFSIAMTLLIPGISAAGAAEPAGKKEAETQVLKWKDGKKAAFMLGFDDSAPSQLEHVVPELDKRKIVGNFYLVTGNKLYASLKRRWEDAAKSP